MSERTVIDCYELLELSLLCGIEDYTDGIYAGDPSRAYEDAQRQQHDFLLDQLGVGPGFRLLDVGCGTGTLLQRARERARTRWASPSRRARLKWAKPEALMSGS